MSNLRLQNGTVEKDGTCNYCNRGKLSKANSAKLKFPYSRVIVVHGKHISSNFCEDCFEMLKTAEVTKNE